MQEMWRRKLQIVALIAIALPVAALADDSQWYDGEGVVALANLTPEQARETALDKARENALMQSRVEIVGMASRHLVESTGTDEVYDAFVQFTQRITRGLILEEQVVQDALETVDQGGQPHHQWRVRLRARVTAQVGQADPEFKLDVVLNRSTFRDGEAMELDFKATKDCYLTVLNLYSNDSLRVVLPNVLTPTSLLRANERLRYPPPDSNLSLPVSLMTGKDTDQEAILTIATRDNIPFSMLEVDSEEELISLAGALMTINNWLADIDADQRTQSLLTYRVVR